MTRSDRASHKRNILFESLPLKRVEKMTGWKIGKPIDSAVPRFLKTESNSDFVRWATEEQCECNLSMAFYLIFDAIDSQPRETLELKARNCAGKSTEVFPNQVAEKDISHVAKKPFWTPVEATLLSLGVVPDDELLTHFANMGKVDRDNTFNLVREYDERLELIRMKFSSSAQPEKIEPVEIIKFLRSRGMSLPKNLVKAVSKVGNNSDVLDFSQSTAERRLKPLEKKSCLEVIGAILSDSGYSIDSLSNDINIEALLDDLYKKFPSHNRDNIRKIIVAAVQGFARLKTNQVSLDMKQYDDELMLNTIGFLAQDGYGYTLEKRSNTVSDIQSRFYLKGLNKDKKTIKKFLDLGLKSLP